jgi:hypothetical protein
MKKILFTISTLILILSFNSAQAVTDWKPVSEVDPKINEELIKVYKNYIQVPKQDIVVPTTLEVSFSADRINNEYFGVYNETDKKFTTSLVLGDQYSGVNNGSAIDAKTNEDLSGLFTDGSNFKKDFYLDKDGNSGSAVVYINYPKAIKSNSLNISFDNYVLLPKSLTLKAEVNGMEVIVLNKIKPTSSNINFLTTTASKWILEMEYSQPLRISNIHLNDALNASTKKIIFLSLPNKTYRIYANPEVVPQLYTNDDYSNVPSSMQGTKKIGPFSVLENPSFVLSDSDKDSIPDVRDNCPGVPNFDQEDIDQNGRGDVCDDYDRDGIINSIDNCRDVLNYDQRDTDGDKIGDTCDSDESRFTEKYPWIVWAGIAFAAIVFLVLLFIAGNEIRKQKLEGPQGVDIDL